MSAPARFEAISTLARYLEAFPEEARELRPLSMLLMDERSDPFSRSNPVGHVTTSAVVLSPAREILMIHHRFLNRWLPPGGHYEPPGSLWGSAAREVFEETGVTIRVPPFTLEKPPIPLRIHSHRVPVRPEKNEGEHYHHDFRYLALAERGELTPQLEEVQEVRWVPLAEFGRLPEPDMQILYQKLLQALEQSCAA